jgi:hypothetical protein
VETIIELQYYTASIAITASGLFEQNASPNGTRGRHAVQVSARVGRPIGWLVSERLQILIDLEGPWCGGGTAPEVTIAADRPVVDAGTLREEKGRHVLPDAVGTQSVQALA